MDSTGCGQETAKIQQLTKFIPVCALKFQLLLARLCRNAEMGKGVISVSQGKLTADMIFKITSPWNVPDTNLSLTLIQKPYVASGK